MYKSFPSREGLLRTSKKLLYCGRKEYGKEKRERGKYLKGEERGIEWKLRRGMEGKENGDLDGGLGKGENMRMCPIFGE